MRGAPNTAVALSSVLVAGVVAGGALLLSGEAPLPVAGGRVHLDGSASVVRADGTAGALADGDIVHPGDEIEVTGGTLVLELAAGGTVEGRAGRDDAADSLLEVGAPVRLLAGDLLAEGPAGLRVDAAGTVVTLAERGAARISRDLAVTTATYEGEVAVDSAGEHRQVRALRQLSVASVGRLPSAVDPVRYDTDDPWDLRYLGEAVDLTRRLDTLSRSFALAGTGVSASDLERLLPALGDAGGFGPSLLSPERRAGETVVGAAIAGRAAARGDGPGRLADRWAEVFAFRDDGATWGLVALDQHVDGGDLLADVELALGRSLAPASGDDVAAGAPGSPSGATSGGSTGTDASTSTPTTQPAGSVTVPTSPVPVPDTTLPPTTLPPPPEILPGTGDVLGGLLDPVDDLLGGLTP